jgi:hypothetical protein
MSDGGRPEPEGGVEAAREVVECAQRTLAERGVRIELRQQFRMPRIQQPRPRGLAAMVLRVAGRLGGLLFRVLRRRPARRPGATEKPEFGRLVGEGIAEPARGRYMINYGSYAEMRTGGETFGGRSGRPVQELPQSHRSAPVADVLWLLRVLRGATRASLAGTDTVRGTECRRFDAYVDLERASAAVAGGLAAPQVDRFEQLRALPVTVWIDGEHVRRVEFEQGERPSVRRALELWEFDVAVDQLDWSRLPQR